MSRQYSWFSVFCILLWASTAVSAATLGFQPAATYPVGTAPSAVAAGDFNGDGQLDLAVVNAGDASTGDDGSVSILLNNGDGTFKAAMNFSACKNCTRIAAGDFNGDGKFDLALLRLGDATASDDGDVTIFLSNGDGTFHKGQVLTPGKNPSSVLVQDFNADHRPDLAVSNLTDNTVAILLGKGDGTFQAPVPYATVNSPFSILLVDFNQNNLEDLAVSRGLVGTNILLANGDGTFRAGPTFNTFFSRIAAWADLDQDGKIDYVISGCSLFGSCSLRVALGNGDGTFQSSRSISAGNFGAIFIADYDGDGKLDIAGSSQGQITVLQGNGDGTFQAAVNFTITSGVDLTAGLAADLNGDKAPDLVTINSDSTVGVLLNTGTDFSISASQPSPASISAGQSSTATVTVRLLNAFDNPVALACSVQPAGAGAPTCSLSSASVTPDPNGSATATLTINTGASAGLGITPFAWLLVPVMGLVGTGVSRGKGKRKLTSCLAGGVLFAGLLVQMACGGDGGPKTQTYTVTITGTSTFTEHSTSVTLAVR